MALYRGFAPGAAGAAGLRLSLHTADESVSLLPVSGSDALRFTYRMRGGVLRFDGEGGGLECSITAGVSARDLGEIRVVEIKPRAALSGELRLEFEPALAREADWDAHPAYWRLGLTAKVRGGALLLRRLPRSGLDGCWLCLAADAGAGFRANIDGEPLARCRTPT